MFDPLNKLVVCLAFGLLACANPACAQQPPAKEYYQDFRGSRPLQSFLRYVPVPADPDAVFKPEEGGLRITLPAARTEKQPVGVRLQFPLAGDFEITGSYELLSSDKTADGAGWPVGVALNLAVKNDYKVFAKLGRFILAKQGQVFVVENWNKEQSKQTKWLNHPAQAPTGRVRLVREGSLLRYLVADGPGGDFHEMYAAEFSAEDVGLVRFAVSGHPVAVEARLLDLRIRVGSPAPGHVAQAPILAPPEDHPPESKGWLAAALLLGAAVILLLALALAGWFFLRPRRDVAKIAASDESKNKKAAGRQRKK